METEPSNTLKLPHQPWEGIPVVKLKEGDAGGGREVEEWEGARLTVSGTGLGCFVKALHKMSIYRAQGIRHSGEKQVNPLLPAFFFTMIQISLCCLPRTYRLDQILLVYADTISSRGFDNLK